jgi:hypothetical protein
VSGQVRPVRHGQPRRRGLSDLALRKVAIDAGNVVARTEIMYAGRVLAVRDELPLCWRQRWDRPLGATVALTRAGAVGRHTAGASSPSIPESERVCRGVPGASRQTHPHCGCALHTGARAGLDAILRRFEGLGVRVIVTEQTPSGGSVGAAAVRRMPKETP